MVGSSARNLRAASCGTEQQHAGPAFSLGVAGGHRPSPSQREENQQDRIAQGVKSGQLTAGETAKLENNQRAINQQVKADRAANGGKLTAGEKAQVNKEQNRQSKNIYNKKHNARTQPGTRPAPKK